MVEKGIGSYQIGKAQKSQNEIMKVLDDHEWHRYQDLVKLTRLSQPTLSKHLKQMLTGMIEKKIDASGSEYPYPVFYRIKPNYQINKKPRARIRERPTWSLSYKLYRLFDQTMELLRFQALWTLKTYFLEKNEAAYEQQMQAYVIAYLENEMNDLKRQLEDLSETGEDIPKLIDDAENLRMGRRR